jgi:predicted Zn-ribbon and HTH transcriptional regulator
MNRLVYSEKEKKYVELPFVLVDGQKKYDELIIAYDEHGNAITEKTILQEYENEKQKQIDSKGYARYRYDICNGCEAKLSLERCRECGCFIPLKVLYKPSKCPWGKW